MLQRAQVETEERSRRSRQKTQYDFREQVGFLLRTAFQRHTSIFMAHMVPSLTQAQLAAIAALYYDEPLPHNELGQRIGFDATTVKGIVDRLKKRGLVKTWTTLEDRRSRTVILTARGRQIFEDAVPHARKITRETLKPLSSDEQMLLIGFLKRIR